MLAALVALAAGAGAVLRYLLVRLVDAIGHAMFPYGTLIVNLTGSLVMGLVLGLGRHHGLPSDAVIVLSAGLAGGYTTLSTWAWETLVLAESGSRWPTVVNAVGTVAACLAAAGVGLALTSG